MDLEDSYFNWVTKYDLVCASKTEIGMIGSVGFIGWMITLLFLPRISDMFGRKELIKFGFKIQAVSFFLLSYAPPSYNWLIFSLGVLGLMWTIRTQISSTYIFENFSSKHYDAFIFAMSMIEGHIGLAIVYYFNYVSKNGLILIKICLLMQVLGVILSFFIFASPMYLAKSG